MKCVKAFQRIETDETLREKASHGDADYPFQYYLEDVWAFDFHSVDWHWHPELELIYIKSGEVLCSVGSESMSLKAGCGMLINSRAIHRFDASASAVMPNIVFSPSLLAAEESLVYKSYVLPIIESGRTYIMLSPETEWQKRVLELAVSVFDLQENDGNELKTLRILLEIWQALYDNLGINRIPADGAAQYKVQARLQRMMQFIHENYLKPITLESIAASVFISKSSALSAFQEGIRLSPVSYLLNYRLRQAARLLRETDRSVSLIASETGFHSSEYLCRRFKELYRATPTEYRKAAEG